MSTDSDRQSMAPTVIDVVIQPMESVVLRSESTKIVDRMYSDSGTVGIVVPADVIALLAVFQKNRNAVLSREPRLIVFAKTYVLNKLLTRTPFHHIDPNILFDMRRYITLLAEVLRAYRDEENFITIEHVTRSVWYYEGVNKLAENLESSGRGHSNDLEIEWCDAKINLKHCQYMLLSLGDSWGRLDYVLGKTGQIIKGVLEGYGGQYNDAKTTLDEILSRQRRREPWHEEYMELEAMYFQNLAYATDISIRRAQKEKKTIIALRDRLERELGSKTGQHSSSISRGFQKLLGEIGKRVAASGPYEEHQYYFEYLLIDLLYKASFLLALRYRPVCFGEMIGGIQSALLWSHDSAKPLHLKATDLYYRIKRLVKEDNVEYIKEEHRRVIEQWIKKYPGNSETEENSLR
jgi:hypothetical protein